MMRSRGPRRSGLASMWGLVVLIAAGTMLGCLSSQLLSNRRDLDRRQNRLQAQWLARGGLELAAERLLMDAATYKGETTDPLTNSSVKISVVPVAGQADQYQVTSVARFPTDGRDPVAISLQRRLRRTVEGGKVKLTTVQKDLAASLAPGQGK